MVFGLYFKQDKSMMDQNESCCVCFDIYDVRFKGCKAKVKTGEALAGGQRFTSYLLISQESLRSITRRFVYVDLNITSHLINHHFKPRLLRQNR